MKKQSDPFVCWLLRGKDRNDPIGDLAKDMQGDKSLPSGLTYYSLLMYLRRSLACAGAYDALDAAFDEWRTLI